MSKKKNIKEQKAKGSDSKESKKDSASSKKKFSIVKPIKGFVSGDFLKSGYVERNLPFLGFLAALMLFYIGYQYYVDNTVREQAREDRQQAELYSKLQSVKEEFNTHSLQSTVADATAEIGMFESVDPPTVIAVGDSEISE